MLPNYWHRFSRTRLSRRRALIATGAGASAAVFIAACGGGDGNGDENGSGLLLQPKDTTKDAKRGGIWLGSHNADVQTFDPHFQSVPNQALTQFTYSRLFKAKPGRLEPAIWGETTGDLAQSWEYNPDKTQLTIKLHDTKWHDLAPVNGRALDANDVVFTWQRLEKVGTNRTLFANSVSPNAPIETVTAPDNKTVVLKLKFPAAALLSTLATFTAGSFYVVPKEAESGIDLARTQVGSGPFMLAEYNPSSRYVYKRHDGYYDANSVYIDEIHLPIVAEYATVLAQFRAGAIYRYGNRGEGINGEDVLPLKQSIPQLELYQGDVRQQTYSAFYGWNPARGENTPFRDRRMRQAFSMSWDRDLFIDAAYNVSALEAQGIPLETRWNTPVYNVADGWWLDPKGKDFGPNARYYQFNLEEAKKLVAAAGYAGGLDVDAQYVTTGQYGTDFNKQVEIIINFARDAGIRMQTKPVGFTTDWRPKVADSQGDFDGISFRIFPEGSQDWGDRLFSVYHPEGGLNYTGLFNQDTSSYKKGDPRLNEIIEKVRTEFDNETRISLIEEFQRLDAPEMYRPRFPGSAAALSVIWPVIRNHRVQVGDDIDYVGMWLDPTKAPLGKT
jgi:peptide/nickel transport system substrate-binding protein